MGIRVIWEHSRMCSGCVGDQPCTPWDPDLSKECPYAELFIDCTLANSKAQRARHPHECGACETKAGIEDYQNMVYDRRGRR